MARLDEHAVIDESAHPLVSWSAIFAGLFFVLGSSALMLLLGSALGLGVADMTEGDAAGELGIAAIIWMLVTSIITFFLGSLLAGRLNGSHDDGAGILSGITLWSIGTVLLAYMATAGVMGAAKVGGAAVESAVSMTAGGVAAAGGGATASAGLLENTSIGNQVAAMVKSAIAEQLSEVQEPPPPTQQPTDMNQQDQQDQQDQQNQQQDQQRMQQSREADRRDIRRAVDEIDVEALQQIGIALVRGDTEGAKSILALNTSLDEQQIDAVVEGVSQRADEAVENARREIADATETASAYSQAVVWAAFVSGALGLVVSIVGGLMGARTTKRLHVVRVV